MQSRRLLDIQSPSPTTRSHILPLTTMVMPLPQQVVAAASGSPTKHHALERSPIKKHLREAANAAAVAAPPRAATTTARSPLKLKATVAQCSFPAATAQSTTEVRPSTTTTAAAATASGFANARLRASMLQAMLSLMDRDDHVLHETLPLLHLLATMPLEDAAIRRECLAALQQLGAPAQAKTTARGIVMVGSGSTATADVVVTGSSVTRDSGRVKSAVTLRHCKEFLLACANEIHELEEVNPCFDYAETCSEAAAPQRQTSHVLVSGSHSHRGAFDYSSPVDAASTVDTCAPLDEVDVGDTDDADADQGSQLSEVLCRAAELDPIAAPSHARHLGMLHGRLVCRRAFQHWRQQAQVQARSRSRRSKTARAAGDLATVYHAFNTLKCHRAMSTQNVARKYHAFGRMKSLVRARPPRSHAASTPLQRFLAQYWDLVALIVLALAMQSVAM